MNVYVDNFLLVSSTMVTAKALKKPLGKEYEIKDFRKVKTIIEQQIIRDLVVYTMKINQSVIIRNLVIEKNSQIVTLMLFS